MPAAPSEREALEQELARLRQRYTDAHPDIQALLARVQALGKEAAPAPGTTRSTIAAGQLERAASDVKTLLARRQDLRDQIAGLQRRVDQMPRTEQELALLTRDFHQLRDNYQALLRKRMEAETAERLQQRWTEDFEIIDPARVPEHHSFPNRPLFLLVGGIVGLGLGLGAAVLAEHFNPDVIGPEDLQAATRSDLLAVLPFVEDREAEPAGARSAVPPASRRGPAR
jgi:tyrosine-protein kinase Etk/Wzc